MVGPSFSGKTYILLKTFSRIPNRVIYKINKLPPEQYSNTKIKIEETREEIKTLNKDENTTIVVHDILGSSNSKYIDQFFIRGRHKNTDVYYLSQSYFDFPKEQSEMILLKQFCLTELQKILKTYTGTLVVIL